MKPAPGKPTSWATIRSVFHCALVLLVVALAAAGFGAHSLWRRADSLLRSELERQIAERVPDWDLSFSSARAETSGRVRLQDVVLRDAAGGALVELPEVIIDLDVDLLFEHQKVLITRIVVPEAVLRLRCDESRRWNFEGLSKPRTSDSPLPDVVVERATVLVRMEETSDWPRMEFKATGLALQASPISRRAYAAAVEGDIAQVGRIELQGQADHAHGTWSVAGRIERVDLEGVLRTMAGVSPVARERMSALAAANRSGGRGPVRQASVDGGGVPADVAVRGVLEQLGVQADMTVDFSASQAGREADLRYAVMAEIRDGQFTNRMLPVPLYGVKGKLAVDQDRVIVKSLTASNGDSGLHVDGRWDRGGAAPVRRVVLQATDVHLGPELRNYLPGKLAEKYDELRPRGRFSVNVEYDESLGDMPLKLREFSVADGSMRHELFPLEATSVHGTIRQEGRRLELNFKGLANGRKSILEGTLDGLGPDAALRLKLHVDDLPVDATFLQAFADSQLDKARKLHPILMSLTPGGRADWQIDIERPAGAEEKFRLARVIGRITQGSVRYDRFPYVISNVEGMIEYDPAVENVWHFRDMRGQHGETKLSGSGSFALTPAPGRLSMQITALGVPIDGDLRLATVTALPELQTAWTELAPTGTLDLTNASLAWTPGTPVEVALPGIQFRDAKITPAALPFPWERLNGAARWRDGRLVLHTVQGWHGDTYLNINGVDASNASSQPLAYFEDPGPDGAAWRLHLGDVQIRKLSIDDELRGALPTSIRSVVAELGPTQPIDLAFALDLKGFGGRNDPVTARWQKARATFGGGDVTLGVPVRNVRGFVELSDGMYDGRHVHVAGFAQFDEAEVFSLPLKNLRGPFRVRGNELIVGTPVWIESNDADLRSPLDGRPLTAEIYGGDIALDASADLIPANPEASVFGAEIKLRGARLEDWARVNWPKDRMSGNVAGEVRLRGVGSDATRITGAGWGEITQAQLYDLPVFVKVFQLIQFRPPENSAFNRAYGEFELRDGKFDFQRIGLVGNAISLYGKGFVGFAGGAAQTLDLQLYTMVQNRTPIVGPIIERLGRRWVGIHVLGSISEPTAVTQARIPLLDDAFKGLMQALERGEPPRQAPRINGR
ncbi:MAG: hypothetical protein KF774_07225 [Planctomyces sp.]|nr:hypothetical protein [Planctomyces sp.]